MIFQCTHTEAKKNLLTFSLPLDGMDPSSLPFTLGSGYNVELNSTADQ